MCGHSDAIEIKKILEVEKFVNHESRSECRHCSRLIFTPNLLKLTSPARAEPGAE
jgi:hypothetical protein